MTPPTDSHLVLLATIARLVVETALLCLLWFRRGSITQLACWVGSLLSKAGAGAWSPVFIDGLLWVCIALFGFMQAYLSTDEAYKYCNPGMLFWMKFCIGSVAAACGALKAFRSTTYSESRKPMANTVLPTPPPGSTLQPVPVPTPPLTAAPPAPTIPSVQSSQPAPPAGAQPTGNQP